jgi:hypothetical protein
MNSKLCANRDDGRKSRIGKSFLHSHATCGRNVRASFFLFVLSSLLVDLASFYPRAQETVRWEWPMTIFASASAPANQSFHQKSSNELGINDGESYVKKAVEGDAAGETQQSPDEWAWEPPIVLVDKLQYTTVTFSENVEAAVRSIAFSKFDLVQSRYFFINKVPPTILLVRTWRCACFIVTVHEIFGAKLRLKFQL